MPSYKLFYENILAERRLHPEFWDGDVFKESLRTIILKIVKDFLKKDPHINKNLINDIQLTGSLANYNYGPYSDIDVHILLDYEKINPDYDLVKRALDSKRFIWNLKHNINLNNHEVELYFQDIHEPHVSSGLYSLQDNKWIKKPKSSLMEVDDNDVNIKANTFISDINMLKNALQQAKDEKDYSLINKKAKTLKDRIIQMRREGLQREGEVSIENLAFKRLRNKDYIKVLNDLIIDSYDSMFSNKVTKNQGLNRWLKDSYSILNTRNIPNNA